MIESKIIGTLYRCEKLENVGLKYGKDFEINQKGTFSFQENILDKVFDAFNPKRIDMTGGFCYGKN